MERPESVPIRAELVPAGRERPPALVPVILALAPLVARLAYWWLSRPRSPVATGRAWTGAPALWEHTEVRMTKRLLGRWRIRVTSTRWSGPAPAGRPGKGARRPRTWGPLVGGLLQARLREGVPARPLLPEGEGPFLPG